MEGFLDIRLLPWLRRLITRGIAIIPAAVVAAYYHEKGVGQLLLISQVRGLGICMVFLYLYIL